MSQKSRPYTRRQAIKGIALLSATAMLSAAVVAQPLEDVRQFAELISVRVLPPGAPGSGVLVYREGNNYFVLTAKHVVEGTFAGEEALVLTHDGERHPVDTSAIQLHPDFDLAVLAFQSSNSYETAAIGNSNELKISDNLSVAGFPIIDGVQSTTIFVTPGQLVGLEDRAEGYSLFYDIQTLSGMSGGPVLNSAGDLVGIHGRAIGRAAGETTIVEGIKFGIPIARFQEWQGVASSPRDTSTPQPTPEPEVPSAQPTPEPEVATPQATPDSNVAAQDGDCSSLLGDDFSQPIPPGITCSFVNSGTIANITSLQPILVLKRIENIENPLSDSFNVENQLGLVQPGTSIKIIGETKTPNFMLDYTRIEILAGRFSGNVGWVATGAIEY